MINNKNNIVVFIIFIFSQLRVGYAFAMHNQLKHKVNNNIISAHIACFLTEILSKTDFLFMMQVKTIGINNNPYINIKPLPTYNSPKKSNKYGFK